MSKKLTRKVCSDRQAGDAAQPPVKPAESFFHKPAGVFLICILLYGLTVWTFSPALKTGFHRFDDDVIFLRNSHVNTGLSLQNVRWALFSTDYSYSYPLPRISHMLDFTLYGAEPWGHHLTNVLIHAANGVLLFLVLRRMTGALWRSLIVALLFALHPLRVESVVWVSERKDVMSTCFGLFALLAYARYAREPGARSKEPEAIPNRSTFSFLHAPFYWLSLLFFAFALMSKSMLVTFPCLLLVLDYWPLRRVTGDQWQVAGILRLVLEKIPFFVLVGLVSVATWFASRAGGGTFIMHLPWPMRLETAVMGYSRYLALMFWPAQLSAFYPYPAYWPTGQWLGATVLFLGMSALAFVWRRQRPWLLTGWLWYVGTLAPVIGLIPLGGESICTRFTYIPMMGALLLFVWGIDELTRSWRRRAAVITALVALAAALCVIRTRAETAYWKDSVTLYNHAIAVTTNNFMAHYCLACVLSQTDPEQTLVEYQKSVDIYPDYATAQRELGVCLCQSGRFAEAIGHFERAIQLEPQNGWAYHNLALALVKTGRAGEAVPLVLKAIETDPQNASSKDELGAVMFSLGHPTETVDSFLATARSDPAGFARFLDAMQFDTNQVALVSNLAWAFATNPDPQLRSGEYAVRLAKRVCEMTGFQTNKCVGILAVAYAEDSKFDLAITNAQLACSLTSAAGQTEQLKEYQMLLEMFRAHKAYRDATQ